MRGLSIRLTQNPLVDLADARLCQTVDELDLLGDAVFRDDTSGRERLQVCLDIGFEHAMMPKPAARFSRTYCEGLLFSRQRGLTSDRDTLASFPTG